MRYTSSLEGITLQMFQGKFFVGWQNPPSSECHLKILQSSYAVEVAIDEESGQVVGFVNAISDGVLSAYIPLLEVLPAYQRQGVGEQLMKRILSNLNHLYMVDLLCDEELQTYYEKIGMQKSHGMIVRNYNNLGPL